MGETEERAFMEELSKYVKPLMKLLKDNTSQHTKILVSHDISEIIEGIGIIVSDEFIKANKKSSIISTTGEKL